MSQAQELALLIAVLLVTLAPPALAYDPIDRTRPQSVQDMQLQAPNKKLIDSDEDPQPSSRKKDDLDQAVKTYIKLEDCPALLMSISSRDYETTAPETLALIATCEPPGKDPEKIFQFAEKKMPSSDVILFLHARYALKRQSPHAVELFEQLYKQTKDQTLSQLASQYLPVAVGPAHKKKGKYTYVFSAEAGGIEEANPQGVAISDPSFGNNVSTAGLAAVATTLRRRFNNYSLGIDSRTADTTYWLTHNVDFLTEDADLPIETHIGESYKIGLRPFGSFYLLAGARYYTASGAGLTLSHHSDDVDHWMQISSYQDSFWLQTESAQSATHERLDYQISLTQIPTLTPVAAAYVDYATAGVDMTGGNFIPYSHTEAGLAASFSRVVHRYSVGLSIKTAFRFDSQQTVLLSPSGTTVAKTRDDFQILIRPSLTVPLAQGLDLYMYFESNSISSNLVQTDGLDRNISDNLIGALLKVSVANF